MNKHNLKKRVVAALLCSLIVTASLAGCADNSTKEPEQSSSVSDMSDSQEPENVSSVRSDADKQMEELKAAYQKNPQDEDMAMQYAHSLYTLGKFDKSLEVVKSLLSAENPPPAAIALSAQIEYMAGNYEKAEQQYKTLIEDHYEEYGMAAQAGLQMVYYQTKQFSKANELFNDIEDMDNSLLDMMKAFGETEPYQVDWNEKDQTVIPFVATDPLPVIPIEINGVRMNAFLDTGGPMLMVDEAIADDLGIEKTASDIGEGGGGSTDIHFGKTDSLKMGDVEVKNVPVMTASFEGFSKTYSDAGIPDVHACIGTNVFQQFIPVIDYLSGELVLVPRNESGKAQVRSMQAEDEVLEKAPFHIASTHYMFSQGAINGKLVNMFVDSGAFDHKGAGIELSKETLEYLGMPIPELETVDEGYGGLGGSDDVQKGWFGLDSFGIGKLQADNGTGYYDTSDVLSGWVDSFGFYNDALISHNYLKQYKWTIDYDEMSMTFSK